MACRLFELYGRETNMKLLAKELPPLQGVGSQNCITFSVDGSRFAAGGAVSTDLDPMVALTCCMVFSFSLLQSCTFDNCP